MGYPFDDVAADRSDEMFLAWVKRTCSDEWKIPLENLVATIRGDQRPQSREVLIGGFNAGFIYRYKNSQLDTVLRFPQPGRQRFPNEKVRKEVAIMGFIKRYTSIPIPEVLDHGECDLGPYIIMQYVDGHTMSEDLEKSPDDYVLNEEVDENKLRKAYRQMADVLVELQQISFNQIGSISNDGTIDGRPLTGDMVFLAEMGNVPPMLNMDQTFSSTREYLKALSDQLFHHLKEQRHGFVKDEADCRRKYIARCLFQKIISLLPLRPEGEFRLTCDDFRPSNVLVDDELEIKAVLDWEFCYAAPQEFGQVPPWWLLLQRPEEVGFQSFETKFKSRFPLFVEALSESESLAISNGRLQRSQCVSEEMKKDMENNLKLFWILYAARNAYFFDEIYWTFIHHSHYEMSGEEELLAQLTDEQRQNLLEISQDKLDDAKVSG
ncbi:phosphotransferase enzyme family protein [Xylona heveae TC161]|uniref:Phosphotransferase enzyme family protein n=1 Tax=Xylona heveae (strain CBS 132557 / TC161) TaxID=1328760 RepID=A0A165GUY8_XYLHT|nr:phosphotransferase enzyme family protein [Xylona heveae TC161]KZF22628.1 phosphotransferase enzyme family protein [Xylona heveae TC161]